MARPASRTTMSPQIAASFWAAVQECLIQFHHFSRSAAAEKVTDVWRRLGDLTSTSTDGEDPFDDMIYHAEPWQIACNLANSEIPLEPNRTAYLEILRKNHLA